MNKIIQILNSEGINFSFQENKNKKLYLPKSRRNNKEKETLKKELGKLNIDCLPKT